MKNRFTLIFLGFILTIYSCQYLDKEEINHPEHFDKIIKIADGKLRTEFKLGLAYIDSAYNSFPNKGKKDLSRKYVLIGETLYITYNDYEVALKYVDSAITVLNLNSSFYAKDLSGIYALKGNILVQQHNYDEAFRYFYLAKELIEKQQDFKLSGWINCSLGNVLYQQERYIEAISFYKKAVSFYSKVDSKNSDDSFIPIQQNLNNIALCYERAKDLNQAITGYKKAIQFLTENEAKYQKDNWFIKMAKGIVYGNLGSTYFKQGNYKIAEECYLKSLELNVADEQDALYTKLKLANLYLTINKNEQVLSLINQIDLVIKDKINPQVKLQWFEIASRYNNKIGNTQKAYNYLKNYSLLKDSVQKINNKIANKDFSKEFVKLSQAREIETLKRKDELKTSYLLLAVGLTTLSTLIILLILRNARITKRNVKQLTLLNEQISNHNMLMGKTLEALEESQESNSHLMKVVAHDMRAPVNGVIGLTNLLLEKDGLNNEQREILNLISISGEDTLKIINELLTVPSTKTNLLKEPVEMLTLLKYCVALLYSKAKEKNQELKILSNPIEINVNREKIWRVISNLISNAVKFSPHYTSIIIKIDRKPSSVLISVKDNGIGIPPDFADKLFKMNTSAQREGTDGEKSFGLGLAISKQIIEAHNGTIWFESTAGFGTTFFVELPIIES